MSGFTDRMIDDGFTDPQAYMEYLESEIDNSFYESVPDWGFEYDEYDDDDDEDLL